MSLKYHMGSKVKFGIMKNKYSELNVVLLEALQGIVSISGGKGFLNIFT